MGVRGSSSPWKCVGGVIVCFDPLKCHILSFIKTVVLDNSASFTSWTMKVNLIFFRCGWNSLMAWPDWPRPPYSMTDQRRWVRCCSGWKFGDSNSGPPHAGEIVSKVLCCVHCLGAKVQMGKNPTQQEWTEPKPRFCQEPNGTLK